MANKERLFGILHMFQEASREDKGLSLKDIQGRLIRQYHLNRKPDRKTLYSDFQQLRNFGYTIEKERENGRTKYYYREKRIFDEGELIFLAEAIKSARFLDAALVRDLITKIGKLSTKRSADKLIKNMGIPVHPIMENPEFQASLQRIYEAIVNNQQISFYYEIMKPIGQRVRRNEQRYLISPWHLFVASDRLFLIGTDLTKPVPVRYYRIDRMNDVRGEDLARDGEEEYKKHVRDRENVRHYSDFAGEVSHITIEYPENSYNMIYDEFGDVTTYASPGKPGVFRSTFDIELSDHSLSWFIPLPDVKVVEPAEAVSKMKDLLERQRKLYR